MLIAPPPFISADPFAEAPAVPNIHQLKAKDFIAYLRRQVRDHGRRAMAGYVGDHIDNPIETWLKEIGFGYVVASSMEFLLIGNEEYDLGKAFTHFIMCVCEPEGMGSYEWAEIDAYRCLVGAIDYMEPECPLIAA